MNTPLPSKPLVSILITYYNLGAFIRETVESARAQSYRNIEIIIVDDGSADPCTQHLSGLTDIYLARQENQGVASARNTAASHARGEFLLFLDGDDRLLPTAVETQVDALLAEPSAGLSFGGVQRINQHGELIRGMHICRPRRDYFEMLLESSPIECMGATMVRRSDFEAIGGFDQVTENLVPVDDYDLYLRLARRGPIVRNPHGVIEYRQHADNISRDKEKMLAHLFTALDKLERSSALSSKHRRRLRYGRRRWSHAFRKSDTVTWKVAEMYYRFRSMLAMRPRIGFRKRDPVQGGQDMPREERRILKQ